MLNIKKDFKWFKLNKDLVYLDNGATTLKPDCVINSVVDYLSKQSTNPHNSDSSFAYKAHDVIEECRRANAKLINCNPNEVVFTSGATESLNLFANSLVDFVNEGDEIVLTYYEHAANLLPWFNLANSKKLNIKYATSDKFNLKPEDFMKVITPKTKIVSFTGTSNVLGNTLPVLEIAKEIRKYNPNIFICVDLAQMIPHHQIDVKKWDIDFAAYSGHKIFGPTGVGVAFIKQKWIDKLKPFKYGGGMNGEINDHGYTLMEKYERFEGGTLNVAGIYGLLSAINYFLSIGFENIAKHEEDLYNLLHKELKKIDHVVVHNWEAKSPIIAFNVKGVHSQDLANYLGKKNIIVRSGLSCAKLLDHVVCQPAVVRASFFLYNDKSDVDKFVKILKEATKEKILSELI